MPRITFIHPALPEPKILDATSGEALIDVVRRAECRCTGAVATAPAARARCASPTPSNHATHPWPRKAPMCKRATA